MANQQPYVTIRSRRPGDANGSINGGPPPVMNGDMYSRSATHDISRTAFHVKHIGQFAQRLEDSAARAFPNRGRSSQRYKNVQALLLHWGCDDLFVLPELEDLEKCLRDDYAFGTDIFAIPSENSHLELMMRIGQLIKDHESQDTLYIVYYGGHARIDESRQSTWCATREIDSPWLQWSAIQTLLERSKSDVLILLDCCAGAASATFPTGNSITETISASSWDAIAPDPGRYSFTNALIEVLQEWRLRVFSAAMLHAEVLARLKHPRPVTINGKHFEARSTPVHFMMTSNHKAPSIEISRAIPVEKRSLSVPTNSDVGPSIGRAASPAAPGDALIGGPVSNEPTEDTPHVMISLALEDDQRLDINAWEQWLNAFPAMAKYVKIQGVFKSHSTMMLVSMPVMIWDLLPEDPATSFVAFIRSNNIAAQKHQAPPATVAIPAHNPRSETTAPDTASAMSGVSGTTFAGTENSGLSIQLGGPFEYTSHVAGSVRPMKHPVVLNLSSTPGHLPYLPSAPTSGSQTPHMRPMSSTFSVNTLPQYSSTPSTSAPLISRHMILNQQQSSRRTTFGPNVPQPKSFSAHVERRLEEYYHHQPLPNDAESAIIASNLGIEPWHLEVWYHHRRERDLVASQLTTMNANDLTHDDENRPLMILPTDLSHLLDISLPGQTLLLDTRPAIEYQKSHIRGAINLRAPQSFITAASPEMIERSFADEQSRDVFSRWKHSTYIVFYADELEHAWQCPSAAPVLHKLCDNSWTGRGFVLKGQYREFSASFNKYIVQADKSSETGFDAEVEEQNDDPQISVTASESQERYAKWLSHVEAEERVRAKIASPTPTSEGMERVEIHEKDLESEFKTRCGDLYRKAQDIHLRRESSEQDNFGVKAQMVEYLDRGLSKMRGHQTPSEPLPYSSKLVNEGYFDKAPPEHDEADEYVEVSKAGDSAGVVRSGLSTPTDRGVPGEEVVRRGRGSSLLNKVFRRS
ncbi:hypothetical protein PT974_10602 [Cladobotryum mycophilum]|uniref:Tyrosine-protein phosphatase non-receptor type 6 n=1 Tax=Cladobotryum mycophilum TaxID=491253 RepID=A0ABR0SAU5_9HYPO